MVDIETYEGNEKYFEKLLDAIEEINNPFMVYINGEKILIDHQGTIYGAVKEENGVLESYAITLDEQNNSLNRLITEYYSYGIFLHNAIPIISRQGLGSKDLMQLYYTEINRDEPKSYLHFYHKNEENRNEIEFQYDVTFYKKALGSYLNYINRHKPSFIDIREYHKLIGNISFSKKSSYFKLEDDCNYSKALMELSNYKAILGVKNYSYEDLLRYFEKLDVAREIPDDILSIYCGKNELVKTLEMATKQYKSKMIQ